VIRRCNSLGIVVDVAHGTFELVKKAASVATKPLVLSHTALTQRPVAWTRLITPDHAKAIAATGGVIGIWPVTQSANVKSYGESIARMVDLVGVDHVGMGTDMLGLQGPSALPGYADLPQLATALASRFKPDEIARILGGNYRRVFEASLS
jgi:membrane dipeptidase